MKVKMETVCTGHIGDKAGHLLPIYVITYATKDKGPSNKDQRQSRNSSWTKRDGFVSTSLFVIFFFTCVVAHPFVLQSHLRT